MDTYAAPAPTSPADVRTMIAAGLATAGQPLAALGWEITAATGKIVADGFESPVATRPLAADREVYLAAVVIAPGPYRLKVAAVGSDGRRATVEHAFDVRAWPAGPVRMSDLLLGELPAAGFRPSPRLAPGAARLRHAPNWRPTKPTCGLASVPGCRCSPRTRHHPFSSCRSCSPRRPTPCGDSWNACSASSACRQATTWWKSGSTGPAFRSGARDSCENSRCGARAPWRSDHVRSRRYSTAFSANPTSTAFSTVIPARSARSRTCCVSSMLQNFGPHIEQKWASLAPSAGSV